MHAGEERAEDDADATDDNVGDAQKGILAAHDGAGRDDDGFGTAVGGDGEVCGVCQMGVSMCVDPGEGAGIRLEDLDDTHLSRLLDFQREKDKRER